MAIRAIAVEDDEAVAKLITQILVANGFDVCGVAHTGEDGVALALREKPDVALVDLGLPVSIADLDVARHVLKTEARAILAEQGTILIHCEFCQQEYRFDAVALDGMFHVEVPAARH